MCLLENADGTGVSKRNSRSLRSIRKRQEFRDDNVKKKAKLGDHLGFGAKSSFAVE
jgi:hypothetical protein